MKLLLSQDLFDQMFWKFLTLLNRLGMDLCQKNHKNCLKIEDFINMSILGHFLRRLYLSKKKPHKLWPHFAWTVPYKTSLNKLKLFSLTKLRGRLFIFWAPFSILNYKRLFSPTQQHFISFYFNYFIFNFWHDPWRLLLFSNELELGT